MHSLADESLHIWSNEDDRLLNRDLLKFLTRPVATGWSRFFKIIWPAPSRSRNIYKPEEIFEAYVLEKKRENPSAFVKVVRSLRNRYAKFPEDRAFAIYGILRRSGINTSAPDYKRPLGAIYHDLYCSLLQKSPELINLLVDAGIGPLDSPSWVPHWSTLVDNAWLSDSFAVDYLQYQSRSRQPEFNIDDKKLAVKASWKGAVTFCSGTFPIIPRRPSNTDDENGAGGTDMLPELIQPTLALHKWLTTIKVHGQTLQLYESVAAAVFSAIFADKALLRHLKPQTTQEEAQLFDKWYAGMLDSFPSLHPSWGQDDVDEAITAFLEQHSNVRDFVLQCCKRLGGRRNCFSLQREVSERATITWRWGTGLQRLTASRRPSCFVNLARPRGSIRWLAAHMLVSDFAKKMEN